MRQVTAGAALATLGALVLAVAACGSAVETPKGPPPTTAAASGSGTPNTAAASGSAPTAPAATEPLPTPPDPSATDPAATQLPAETLAPPSPAGPVVEDPSLLAVLPADIGGIAVNHEAQAFADAAADRSFAQSVEAAAFAVVVDGEDLASAVVARPIAGVFSDAFFRDWRDSYNEGACGQAGGVVGNAESDFDGQTVYIGTCAGGLRTYHAWLADRGLLVSAFSLGDRRFGEQLMAGLRP